MGHEIGALALSLYVLGLAIGPMSLAPLSEYFGRSIVYIVPYAIYLLLLLAAALVEDVGGFLVLRLLCGTFASITVANLGGTIADLWPTHQVGPPMSLFLWAAVCGSPIGNFLLAFVAQYRGWRDVMWALLGICGGVWLTVVVVLVGFNNETRGSVLLRRRAAKLRKQHNATAAEIDVPDDIRPKSLRQLFHITLTRPFRFLATEAIIIFCALYNGFLYGLTFSFNGAFTLVFGPEGKGFDTIGVGLTFLGLIVGISLGPVVNMWQERYYQRRTRSHSSIEANDNVEDVDADIHRNIPEARVQLGKVAAIALPMSLWWFAWTSPTSYHIAWIVPILATALFGFSFYTLALMTYLYTEDSYMRYSASALAGIGLVRNLGGAGFPLFSQQMFENEGYQWAGTILAGLSMLLIPIPFVLDKYGTRLRAKSPWAREHMDDSEREQRNASLAQKGMGQVR